MIWQSILIIILSLILPAAHSDEKNLSIQIRWRKVTQLGRKNALQHLPEIEKALTHKEWFMRNAGLIAIQSAPRSQALKWSTRLLHDKALVVRTQAVRNLIGLNAVESTPLLWKELYSPINFRHGESLWIRAHLAEALARFSQGRQNIKFFEKLLMDSDQRIHRWAILGLETSRGYKLTDHQDPIPLQRQKWLAHLGSDEI